MRWIRFSSCHYGAIFVNSELPHSNSVLTLCCHTPVELMILFQIYLKLAEEELSGLRGEEITSALRCKQAALVTKARNALQAARDIIKGDHGHPLHHKIKSKFVEVEELFSRIERERAQGMDTKLFRETSIFRGKTGHQEGQVV